jgi:hypothetical protein
MSPNLSKLYAVFGANVVFLPLPKGNPEIGATKKGRLWVKLLLATELVRSDGRSGGFQAESVLLPVSFFSLEAEAVRDLKAGDPLVVGCHLYGTRFESDAGIKHGVSIIADTVLKSLASREEAHHAD